MRHWMISWICLIFLGFTTPGHTADYEAQQRPAEGDYVVLVHGLDWFRNTMAPAAAYLHSQGYETINVRYPSRKIATACEAAEWVRKVVNERCRDHRKQIHLVGHSMGAIVVREYLAGGKPLRLGKVILLAAPNQGTPLADPLRWKPLARMISPAVAHSCARQKAELNEKNPLLPVDYAPAVIMGNQSGWFPMLSPFIKGPDDGVVAVESGKLPGMSSFRVMKTSHTRITRQPDILREISLFLKTGQFSPELPSLN